MSNTDWCTHQSTLHCCQKEKKLSSIRNYLTIKRRTCQCFSLVQPELCWIVRLHAMSVIDGPHQQHQHWRSGYLVLCFHFRNTFSVFPGAQYWSGLHKGSLHKSQCCFPKSLHQKVLWPQRGTKGHSQWVQNYYFARKQYFFSSQWSVQISNQSQIYGSGSKWNHRHQHWKFYRIEVFGHAWSAEQLYQFSSWWSLQAPDAMQSPSLRKKQNLKHHNW